MECSICLEEFEEIKKTESTFLLDSEKKYKNMLELSCGHKFHKKCINNWLKTNAHCPYCRKYFKTAFRCYITKRNKTLGKLAYINIENDNPTEITIDFLNFIFKKKENKKTSSDSIVFTKYNILGVQFNFRNTVYIKYFETLHDEENELEIYVFNKNDTSHVHESFVKVIKNHYISKSTITVDVVDKDEILQNTNDDDYITSSNNKTTDTKLNDVKIISRTSSSSSCTSLNDSLLSDMVLAPVITE